MSAAAPLAGLRILVTRPAAQAANLCALIEARGGTALRFPVLEIRAPADPDGLQRALAVLDRFDWAVFVSVNAVEGALDALPPGAVLPANLRIAAVGARTARALARRGCRVDACPADDFSSEGLLAHPALRDVAGLRFAILRGNGGRDELARALVERGAAYDYIETYRRVRPDVDARVVGDPVRRGDFDFALVNSGESLENLWAMLDGESNAWVARIRLVVPSRRLVPIAAGIGFVNPPAVADNATDQAMVDALVRVGSARARSGE